MFQNLSRVTFLSCLLRVCFEKCILFWHSVTELSCRAQFSQRANYCRDVFVFLFFPPAPFSSQNDSEFIPWGQARYYYHYRNSMAITAFPFVLDLGMVIDGNLIFFFSTQYFCPLCHNQIIQQEFISFISVYYTVSQQVDCPLSTANHLTWSPSHQLSERNLTGSLPLLEQAPNCLDKN